uniref:Uncharacterized protein n=1 Tax=Clastoptera arizonana TaxID=38151 RepID=A0A1B6EEE6_9HEMI
MLYWTIPINKILVIVVASYMKIVFSNDLLDVTIPIAFKKTLSIMVKRQVIVKMLNALLEKRKHEEIVRCDITRVTEETPSPKSDSYLDLLCTQWKGKDTIILLTINPEFGYVERVYEYALNTYAKPVTYMTPSVVSIVFTDRIVFPYKKRMVTRDVKEDGKEYDFNFSFTFVEMTKMNKDMKTEQWRHWTPLQRWCFFVKNAYRLKAENVDKMFLNLRLGEIFHKGQINYWNTEEQQEYFRDLEKNTEKREMEKWMAEQARSRERGAIVKNMVTYGCTWPFIAKVTGLSDLEITKYCDQDTKLPESELVRSGKLDGPNVEKNIMLTSPDRSFKGNRYKG